ncbi:oxidoreductase C-terminal domain-containing protein [Streptomyces canus]|uniref:oxidoreductase C-terminal domain-containing protein n=1 Tax=Streptomyces canus TaxID=58343 RepID=UPI000747FA35|nr:oxidoreductase C-terminal domain-containing protein [Streptomyces canus]KUN04323.1 hypothetical protein AQI96_37530 [Streptomyces canus]
MHSIRRVVIVGASVAGGGTGKDLRFIESDGAEQGRLALVGDAGQVTGAVAVGRPKQFRKARRLIEAGAGWAAAESL